MKLFSLPTCQIFRLAQWPVTWNHDAAGLQWPLQQTFYKGSGHRWLDWSGGSNRTFTVVNIKVWTDCWWYFPKPNWIGGGYNVKHTSYSNLHTEHPFSTLCADEDMTESLCCKHNSDNELCDFRHRRVCSWSSCSAGCRLSPARIQLLVNPIDAQLDLHD